MPLFSIKRIQKELKILEENSKHHNLRILEVEESKRIRVSITMSEDTIYSGETFILEFVLDPMYPIESPEVTFVDLIPINEHVYSNGHICLSMLYDGWTPAHTLFSVCLCIISMLSSSTEKIRPIDDLNYCINALSKSPKLHKWNFKDY
ncbi:putative ubiquitin-conjugating enzyme E2 W [Nosema granulosis]|uniref:Ubiquitin-conjugating enzyme E2 W n=1 Tax=Nosema granulosis TaxID=83296 RepID=A0A9P6H091_9MICR|nr:putative ubiquitin-conjugating enzyme E2 W [Nosema granulosis]